MGVTVRFWKGAWWIFVNHHGRRKAKRVGDRETAVRLAKTIRERLALGDFHLAPAADEATLNAYTEGWLKTVAGTLKASTIRFYNGHLDEHVLPALGSRPVTSIRRQDCRELIADCRKKGLRVGTVKGVLRTLSTVLTQAVEDDLLEANPALRMGRYLRQGDEPAPQINPLTRDEVARLIAAALEHFPRWHPLLLCAVRTGLRQGEIIALRWADLDFAGRFLTVTHNLVRGVLTTPKNHQRRRVDLSAQLTETLAALRLEVRARALADGTPRPATVFASTTGTMLDESNLRHIFYRILEKAGMRHIRFHDLRHTFASLMIQHGESLAYVRDQLGHKSIQITVDVYGHLVPGGNRSAVDRLDDAPPIATPAQPAMAVGDDQNALSLLESVVSRVGIEPTTRRLRVPSNQRKQAKS